MNNNHQHPSTTPLEDHVQSLADNYFSTPSDLMGSTQLDNPTSSLIHSTASTYKDLKIVPNSVKHTPFSSVESGCFIQDSPSANFFSSSPPQSSTTQKPISSIISSKELAAHAAMNFKNVKGVYKNCRGIWAAQWTDERGQRHTKYFNPKYFSTEAEAREEAFRFKIHIAREIELRGGVQKRKLVSNNTCRPTDVILGNSYIRDRQKKVPRKLGACKLIHSPNNAQQQVPSGQSRYKSELAGLDCSSSVLQDKMSSFLVQGLMSPTQQASTIGFDPSSLSAAAATAYTLPHFSMSGCAGGSYNSQVQQQQQSQHPTCPSSCNSNEPYFVEEVFLQQPDPVYFPAGTFQDGGASSSPVCDYPTIPSGGGVDIRSSPPLSASPLSRSPNSSPPSLTSSETTTAASPNQFYYTTATAFDSLYNSNIVSLQQQLPSISSNSLVYQQQQQHPSSSNEGFPSSSSSLIYTATHEEHLNSQQFSIPPAVSLCICGCSAIALAPARFAVHHKTINENQSHNTENSATRTLTKLNKFNTRKNEQSFNELQLPPLFPVSSQNFKNLDDVQHVENWFENLYEKKKLSTKEEIVQQTKKKLLSSSDNLSQNVNNNLATCENNNFFLFSQSLPEHCRQSMSSSTFHIGYPSRCFKQSQRLSSHSSRDDDEEENILDNESTNDL